MYHISEDVLKRNTHNLPFRRGIHESDREGASESELKTGVESMLAIPLTYLPAHFSITACHRPQEVVASIVVSLTVRLDPGLSR